MRCLLNEIQFFDVLTQQIRCLPIGCCRRCYREIIGRTWHATDGDRFSPRRRMCYLNISVMFVADFDFVARWQEGIKTNNQIRMTMKECRHTIDNFLCINTKNEKNNSNDLQMKKKRIVPL